jgi:hypothetical protein
MKTVLTAGFLVLAAGICESQASIMAQWTFESSQPAASGSSSGNFAAENGIYSSTSLASGFHAASSTYSSPPGDRSANSFSSTAWAMGDYYQFTSSTLGYNNVNVSFEAASSSTGPKDFQLSYSTDGTTFILATTYSVLVNGSPNTAWSASMSAASAAVYDFSFNLSALNTQNNIYIRLIDNSTTSAGGGTVGTSGTSRVDDFTISASPIPEPSTFIAGALLGLPFALQRFRRLRNRKV